MTKPPNQQPHRFSIAPMMDWTDRHCRFFHRLLSKRALLYTEMITADAVLHGDRARLIGFSAQEHPIALQLGGSDPVKLAEAAKIAVDFGYDEVNLNVGCPSDRVQDGRFGACLMAEPELVASCVDAMSAATPQGFPITVKCRIGIDDQDSEAALEHFITTVAGAGCNSFAIHARKAWLQGLSPKENRDVPPLDYERVYRLKAAHQKLTISINGGIMSLQECAGHLERVDGVMLGRAIYKSPWLLADVDHLFFGDPVQNVTRADIINALLPYAQLHTEAGGQLHAITRHILGLYAGQPRARLFRRHIAENACRKNATVDVLREAMNIVEHKSRAPAI